MQHNGLTHQFLLSTPQLKGSMFENAVIYMCEHSKEGAMGLMINHELPIALIEMFKQLDMTMHENATFHQKLLDGGPVNVQQGFVLHEKTEQSWENSIQIHDNVFVTTSKDILAAIATQQMESAFNVILGYSGWAAGQIEDELKDGSWMTIPASNKLLFENNKSLIFQHCLDQLGFDLTQLSNTTGNA